MHLDNRIYFLQVFEAVEPCVKCAMTSCASYFAPSWRKVTDIVNEEIFKRVLK